jgi:hypothetical protein
MEYLTATHSTNRVRRSEVEPIESSNDPPSLIYLMLGGGGGGGGFIEVKDFLISSISTRLDIITSPRMDWIFLA